MWAAKVSGSLPRVLSGVRTQSGTRALLPGAEPAGPGTAGVVNPLPLLAVCSRGRQCRSLGTHCPSAKSFKFHDLRHVYDRARLDFKRALS